MDYLLGIDLGSTSIKAVLFDFGGNLITSGSVPTEASNLDPEHPEWVFWDPDIIWKSVVTAIKEVIAKVDHASQIKSVAVSGWGMDGLPIDKDGNYLYPFISWHCLRTHPQSEAFSSRLGAEKLFSIAGTQVMNIHSVYRMMWVKEHFPEIIDKTHTWLLIEDYINYRLSGEISTDFSMASCTSLVDQKKRMWSDDLIKEAGLPRAMFPEIKPSGTQIGEVTKIAARETGLDSGTAVVLGGHDYHCAGLAVGAFDPDRVMDITGTWEGLFAGTPEANLSKDVFQSGLLLESHVVRDRYNYVAYALSAGMLEWYKDYFCAEEKGWADENNVSIWEILMDGASKVPTGSKGVFFLPHFSGAVTPIADPKSLGAFIGLHEGVDRNCMTRALIEGLDYQFRELIEAFESALGKPVEKIIAVGGSTRNEFWMQNKADVSGKSIEVPGCEEATALGTAILAGIGIGVYTDEKDAFNRTYRAGKVYVPDPSASRTYNEFYPIFKSIYPGLKNISHSIFNVFRT
jgi:xylulokinase